jgi:peptidoglycan/LPS O-acetylase OafA/YrhL
LTRVASLDGWRGISILFVLVSHFLIWRYSPLPAGETGNWAAVYLAKLGVSIFFCISGYLIHGLALRELARTGAFSVGGFYARRFFRIVPAFAVYVAFVWLLSFLGQSRDSAGVLPALMFACNFVACPDLLTHTWSLAIEQQFYVLFPLMLLALGSRRLAGFSAYFVIAVALLLWNFRVHSATSHFLLEYSKPFTFIVAGMFWAELRARSHMDFLTRRSGRIFVAYLACLVFATAAQARFQPGSAAAYLFTVWDLYMLPIATGLVLVATENSSSRVLENPALVFVGRISFSLYLWQQLYTVHPGVVTLPGILGAPPLLFIVAAASFYVIERPCMRVGQRLIGTAKPPLAAGALQ